METKKVNIGGDPHDNNYRYKRDVIKLKYESHHGVQTVLVNLATIAKQLQVPVQPIISMLQKRLACKLNNKDDKYFVQTSVTVEQIEKVLHLFIGRFVLCPGCKLPEWNRKFCRACGHRKETKSETKKNQDENEKDNDENDVHDNEKDSKNKVCILMHKMYNFRQDVREKLKELPEFERYLTQVSEIDKLLNKCWRMSDTDTNQIKMIKSQFKDIQK